ncbi:MAG: hypothetical protein V3S52_09890 [Gemmatimonadota bacterium]
MNQETRPEPVIPKEIVRLLDRRATLGAWLAKLNELRGTVRPEVYEKVRGDYEERLRAQETELAAHRSDMEAALAERRARVLQLEAARDERAAELEEAELRFAVGEFKEGEYEKRKEQHDRTLAQLDAELEADRAALAKLDEVVGVLSRLGEETPGAETSPPAPDALPPVAEPPAPVDQEPEAVEEPPEKAPAVAGDADYLDDLEFLESLSLDDATGFDAMSTLLDEEAEKEGSAEA